MTVSLSGNKPHRFTHGEAGVVAHTVLDHVLAPVALPILTYQMLERAVDYVGETTGDAQVQDLAAKLKAADIADHLQEGLSDRAEHVLEEISQRAGLPEMQLAERFVDPYIGPAVDTLKDSLEPLSEITGGVRDSLDALIAEHPQFEDLLSALLKLVQLEAPLVAAEFAPDAVAKVVGRADAELVATLVEPEAAYVFREEQLNPPGGNAVELGVAESIPGEESEEGLAALQGEVLALLGSEDLDAQEQQLLASLLDGAPPELSAALTDVAERASFEQGLAEPPVDEHWEPDGSDLSVDDAFDDRHQRPDALDEVDLDRDTRPLPESSAGALDPETAIDAPALVEDDLPALPDMAGDLPPLPDMAADLPALLDPAADLPALPDPLADLPALPDPAAGLSALPGPAADFADAAPAIGVDPGAGGDVGGGDVGGVI